MDLIEQLICGEEGLRLTVYDDKNGKPIVPGSVVQGHPTIGYGRALDTNGITSDEASFLRQADILKAKSSCSSSFSWFDKMVDERKAVVVSMVFNLGVDGFKQFKEMISALSKQDYVRATSEMLHSDWASQVPARAQQLSRIMLTGVI